MPRYKVKYKVICEGWYVDEAESEADAEDVLEGADPFDLTEASETRYVVCCAVEKETQDADK